VALMVLALQTERAWAHPNSEVAELCTGLAGLSNLMLESDYDFLVWHPHLISNPPADRAPDPNIYNVWIAVRNLCRQVSRLLNQRINLPPFNELFSAVITPLH